MPSAQATTSVTSLVRLEWRQHAPTLASAVAAFLAEHHLSPSSQRVYFSTLRGLQDGLEARPRTPLEASGRASRPSVERSFIKVASDPDTGFSAELLGVDTPLATFDEPQAVERFAVWFRTRYEHTAPATRVRQLAILRSACAFWRKHAWIAIDPTAGLERPRVPLDRTRALTRERIAALWRRGDIALRERVFWRLLYETAARANEILSLDIEDLDLPNKRARVRSKGGATEWVFWQTGAALLLPRLLAGRSSGPVFLADRQPTRAIPSVDRCPLTGRARLSDRRAAELFSEVSSDLTLHQLRHSALTHAAEDGTNTPILLARSRPGPEAVARHLAEHDPARRRL